jgi:hypothetical protein
MTAAPMAITLDATLSGSSSNSYLTMETALQIAANMPGGGEWSAADEELRNLSLIQATRWLETLDYKGDRCKASQRLKWPRNGAVCDGVTSDCLGIPYRVQEAEVALAIQYNSKPNLFPGNGSGGSAPTGTYVKRQKLDVLEIEYDEFSNPESRSCDSCGDPAIIQAFPWLVDLLGCWAAGISTGSNKMIRLYRN